MAIEFFSDKITFGNFSLKLTDSGMEVINLTNNAAGKLYATDFQGFGSFQGSVAGFQSNRVVAGVGFSNIIEKFPFATDSNAVDHGDTVSTKREGAGQSSTVSGYSSGGIIPSPPSRVNIIDKFPFASNSGANDVGDLTQAKSLAAGQSSSVSGYTSGGYFPGSHYNTIEKFPFSTDSNARDVGDLFQARSFITGQSSDSNGYTAGGSPGFVNTIDKFPFTSDTNATDVGDLTQGRNNVTGQSSTISGYTSGGYPAALPGINNTNTIDKFPFATDTNATDVGDLTASRYAGAGQSSTTHGYTSGGYLYNPPTPTQFNTIDKFPFATDTNAVDVGDMTAGGGAAAGHQF